MESAEVSEMKFNCGETWDEKEKRLKDWHLWFAWRPVRVGSHDCRWWEWVERKGRHYMRACWFWDYRARPKGTK